MSATTQSPDVSVILCVYNGADYVGETIKSLLNQTYESLELIIVDDGSKDESWEIVQCFAEEDSRIRPVRNQENRGIAESSNRGLKLAEGSLIARTDQDDLSHPRRIEEQVDCLKENPEIGVVGTRASLIDTKGRYRHTQPIFQDKHRVQWRTIFQAPFNHSAIMFERDLLDGEDRWYDSDYAYAEDFELLSRLLLETHGVNLDCVLLKARAHPDQASKQNRLVQLGNHDEIVRRNIRARFPGIDLPPQLVTDIRKHFFWKHPDEPSASHPVTEAAHRYLDVFDRFLRDHERAKELDELRKRVAVEMFRHLVLHQAVHSDPDLRNRLRGYDEQLYWSTGQYIVNALSRRLDALQNRILDRLHPRGEAW